MAFSAKCLWHLLLVTHASSCAAKILGRATADYRLLEQQSFGAIVGSCHARIGTSRIEISIQWNGDFGKNSKMTDQSFGPTPFSDLPGALVEEVMQRTDEVGRTLLQSFEHVRSERANFRTTLQQSGRLGRDTDLEYPPIPSTCAIDGSYAVERLLTTDLAAAAAVAVEGLTPPSEKRSGAGQST